MKILRVSFSNLNSLKGEHQIDLADGLLAEAGIFSITGPTGSGKSTILDAITLALFGKAARYENESNPGEMMTRGTGECSAEVLFESSQRRYVAKWTRARARKNPEGKLQVPKREISEAATGKILSEKIREADSLIESLTGLDYQRFLRSVLLAQGRFKEFLDAGDNERGDLLEKMTGTEIYSEISQQVYQIESDKKSLIQLAQTKLEGVQLRSEEEMAQLRTEASEKTKQLKGLKISLAELQNQQQNWQRFQKLKLTLAETEQAMLEWEKQDEVLAPSRQKLLRHESTQPFQSALIQWETQVAEQRNHEQQRQTLAECVERKEDEAAAVLGATLDYLDGQRKLKSKQVEDNAASRTRLSDRIKSSERWLEENATNQTIEAALPSLRALAEQLRKQQSDQQHHLRQQNQCMAEQKTVALGLQAVKEQLGMLSKPLAEAREELQTAKKSWSEASEKRSFDHWRTKERFYRRQLEHMLGLVSIREQWQDCEKQEKELNGRQKQERVVDEEARNVFEKQKAICEKEQQTLADKERILQQSLRIASLETQREQLKRDEACPLCGSTEHPFAEHLEVTQDCDQLAVNQQKQVLEVARQQMTEAMKNQTEAASRLKTLELRLQELSQKNQQWQQRFKNSVSQLSSLSKPAVEIGIADDEGFEQWLSSVKQAAETAETKVQQLEKLEQRGLKLRDHGQALETQQQVAETKLNSLMADETKVTGQVEELAAVIKEAVAVQEAGLGDLNKSLGGYGVVVECIEQTHAATQKLEEVFAIYQSHLKSKDADEQKLKEVKHQRLVIAKEWADLSDEKDRWLKKHQTLVLKDGVSLPAIGRIDANSKQRRSRCEQCLSSAEAARQMLRQKEADFTERAQLIASGLSALTQALKLSDDDTMNTIEELKSARLSESLKQELSAEQEQLKRQHALLQGRAAQTQADLESLGQQVTLTAEEVGALQLQLQQQAEEMDALNKRLGEITLLTEQDKQARAGQAEQLKRIESLREDARPWVELSALIGSASGDKFSKFAQGLTLAQLLVLANRHLIEINDRYQIQRVEDSELGLQIVDRYQADSVRPTRSLSGGESFLISLALALGLSDLAGSHTRIESLFIDEGFGTLDAETLDIALAALENLRMSNRTIGIISHVDALKQRISAQIQVSKASNGYGSLTIVNGA